MNIDYDLSNTIEVLAYSIDILVNDPNIKHVLERRYESDFYFVKEAERILRNNYVPSIDDILCIYEPTHGTHEIVVKVTKDHLSTGTDLSTYNKFRYNCFGFIISNFISSSNIN